MRILALTPLSVANAVFGDDTCADSLLTSRYYDYIVFLVPAIEREDLWETLMRKDSLKMLIAEYPALRHIFNAVLGRMPSRNMRRRMRLLPDRELAASDLDMTWADADDVFSASCDEVDSRYPVTRNRETKYWIYAVSAAAVTRLNIAGYRQTSEMFDPNEHEDQDGVNGIPLSELDSLEGVVVFIVLSRETNSYVEHLFDWKSVCQRRVEHAIQILKVTEEFRQEIQGQVLAKTVPGEDLGGWRCGPDGIWRDPIASGPFNPTFATLLAM